MSAPRAAGALCLSILFGCFAVAAASAQDRDMREGEGAELRALDKVTARTVDLTAGVDETVSFGSLSVTVERCVILERENADPDMRARLTIVDETTTGERVEVFSGWMFDGRPWLNPLEHATYDVWLQSCNTS